MPAKSKKQRRAMAIAEHHPEQLHAQNKGLAKMSKSSLHDFAKTKEKGLPQRVKKKKPNPMRFVGGAGSDIRYNDRH